jgi:hypothetical protein
MAIPVKSYWKKVMTMLFTNATRVIPKDGGAEGVRTPDPQNAILVLYQLSYDPIHYSGIFEEFVSERKTKSSAKRTAELMQK